MAQNTAKTFYALLETISAQARTGLAFSSHPYDLHRYRRILKALEELYDLLSADESLSRVLTSLKQMSTQIGDQEYVTPKVAVAVAVFNDAEEILLVNRLDDVWTLPGGYADIALDPIENARKEVQEETGLDIQVFSLLGIFDSNLNHFPSVGRQVYLIVFLGKVRAGTLTANLTEVRGADFFNIESLPTLLALTSAQIQYAYRMHKGENLPPIVEHRHSSD